MSFKIRFGSYFINTIIIITCSTCVGLLDMISPLATGGFRHYTYVFAFLTAFLWLLQSYRQIYSALFGRNVLTVNASYIYDFVGDVKYYWKDIDEIYEEKSLLYINLYEPQNYLDEVGNPINRFRVKLWFKPDERKSSFVINIDYVAANPDELLKLLNEYSIGAEN